jgi:translation initiation factor 4E
LFRADVEPKWEHPANAKGGRWTITVPSQAGRKQFLDKAWLHAVLACIGERLDADNQV